MNREADEDELLPGELVKFLSTDEAASMLALASTLPLESTERFLELTQLLNEEEIRSPSRPLECANSHRSWSPIAIQRSLTAQPGCWKSKAVRQHEMRSQAMARSAREAWASTSIMKKAQQQAEKHFSDKPLRSQSTKILVSETLDTSGTRRRGMDGEMKKKRLRVLGPRTEWWITKQAITNMFCMHDLLCEVSAFVHGSSSEKSEKAAENGNVAISLFVGSKAERAYLPPGSWDVSWLSLTGKHGQLCGGTVRVEQAPVMENDRLPLALRGIPIRRLREFHVQFPGRTREKLNLLLNDCPNLSFVEWAAVEDAGVPVVLISQSWDADWTYMLDYLAFKFGVGARVWIDICCYNQHAIAQQQLGRK